MGRDLGHRVRAAASNPPRRPSRVSRSPASGSRARSSVCRTPTAATTVWLRISAEPLFSPAGELEDVVLTLVDITRLKETATRCATTLAELNDLVETLPDTYVYVDADDTVRRVAGARRRGHRCPAAS